MKQYLRNFGGVIVFIYDFNLPVFKIQGHDKFFSFAFVVVVIFRLLNLKKLTVLF